MLNMQRLSHILVALSLAALSGVASSKTLQYASAFDPQSMDPHALALQYHTRVILQIYEGLVDRDQQFKLEPSLALSWTAIDATTWRFKLRPGVKFHDGSAFTADDAVFSITRALDKTSQRAAQLRGVLGARKVDAFTIDVSLGSPDAVLPEKLWLVAMMSKSWSEQHKVQKPQDYNANQETYAVRHANGTGPFVLKAYESDVRTVLQANPNWWGRATHTGNVDEAVYNVIQNDGSRLAALASGQMDILVDPPYQDVGRLRQNKQFVVTETVDMGTQYLAFDQARVQLNGSDIKGRNPFKDLRVRRAIVQAIDMDLIVKKVLRGQAVATGAHVSQLVDGALPELEARLPYDPAAARALLKEAGYPEGFKVPLECVNVAWRSAVCQAISAMLDKVGIKAQFNNFPSATFFPKLTQASSSFVEFGWTPTPDAWSTLNALVRSHDGANGGAFNAGRYSNPKLDSMIDAIRIEPDLPKRRQLVGLALTVMHEDLPLLPLYRRKLAWIMKPSVHAVMWPNDVVALRWVRLD